MISCTRRIQFCAGHRVMGHENKCAHLHGHNYVALITATATDLDGISRVIDFSVLKQRIGGWIESNWDHGFIVSREDEGAIALLRAWSPTPDIPQKLALLPSNPTAENMADHLLRVVCPTELAGTGVEVTRVELWETENCPRGGDPMKRYRINEVFHSLQGEGMRAGTANVFVRFTGCNLQCKVEPGPKSPGGFDCDTEFASGRAVTREELLAWINATSNGFCPWLVLTGGEPGLQLDPDLIHCLHDAGHRLAIETNGSIALPEGLDWITVSPKVAEHAIRQTHADEVKYVRAYGQAIPATAVDAQFKLISPAFRGLGTDTETLQWCSRLVLENPEWRLSVQMHKVWTLP